jgi:hypothetical protein
MGWGRGEAATTVFPNLMIGPSLDSRSVQLSACVCPPTPLPGIAALPPHGMQVVTAISDYHTSNQTEIGFNKGDVFLMTTSVRESCRRVLSARVAAPAEACKRIGARSQPALRKRLTESHIIPTTIPATDACLTKLSPA